jgi:hypothetical protein
MEGAFVGVIKAWMSQNGRCIFGKIKGWMSQNARCIVWSNKSLDESKWKVHCLE